MSPSSRVDLRTLTLREKLDLALAGVILAVTVAAALVVPPKVLAADSIDAQQSAVSAPATSTIARQ